MTGPSVTAPIIAVVGATATGKSDLGVELALRLGGEIVSSDASQLYRGMDIGTAKLTLEERRGIAHHQLDVLEVTQEASVAAYQLHGREDIAAIRARGHRPLVVGGSGLYVRALLDRLEIPPTDPAVRAEVEAELEEHGLGRLRAELLERDPEAAANIEANNARRIVRALEVIRITGRPFSATMPTREFEQPTFMIGLRAERDVLDERLDARVRRMFDGGLVEETRALEPLGLRQGRTASRALGYAQALAVIDGTMDVGEAIEDTARRTRKFARRQEAWFGPDPRIHWLDATDASEGAQRRRLDEALRLAGA